MSNESAKGSKRAKPLYTFTDETDEIEQIARIMATTFKDSKRAQLWYTFTNDMREALIDACVMDQVRGAAVWRDESLHYTVKQLMAIRRAFVRALHTGIPRRGNSPLRYVLEGDTEDDEGANDAAPVIESKP